MGTVVNVPNPEDYVNSTPPIGGVIIEAGKQIAAKKIVEKTHEIIDSRTGESVAKYSSLRRALHAADKKDNEYGAVRYIVKKLQEKGGGMYEPWTEPSSYKDPYEGL